MSTYPPTPSEPALRLRGVSKRFGSQQVIAGLDLDVERGELFALVGLNGAGKTTLIKSILDFCAVDGGAVELFGVSHLQNRSRARLAFLPERFTPPYYLTGADFLRYMGALYGTGSGADATHKALAALDLAPDALAKPVRALSKGMAQKLGLAGCLLSGRELLVLDEPMSGLDPRARALLKQRLRELRDAGRTVFFSTHLLEDVEALCDRMAILHAGQMRFVGTPAQCRERFQAPDLEQAFLKCIAVA